MSTSHPQGKVITYDLFFSFKAVLDNVRLFYELIIIILNNILLPPGRGFDIYVISAFLLHTIAGMSEPRSNFFAMYQHLEMQPNFL